MSWWNRVLLLAVSAWVGCAQSSGSSTCETSSDCDPGQVCLDRTCMTRADAGMVDMGDAPDLGIDLGPPDAGTDLGPSCSNGVQDGDETDIDCGGSCESTCDDCSACNADSDCALGRCAEGVCRTRSEHYVDWVAHCSTDGSASYTSTPLPAGEYRIIALMSAQSAWSLPHSPPDSGWFWRYPCTNLGSSAMRTPAGTVYATEAEAFDALTMPEQVATFAGGAIECQVTDSNCSDNLGGARFAVERECPASDSP